MQYNLILFVCIGFFGWGGVGGGEGWFGFLFSFLKSTSGVLST